MQGESRSRGANLQGKVAGTEWPLGKGGESRPLALTEWLRVPDEK